MTIDLKCRTSKKFDIVVLGVRYMPKLYEYFGIIVFFYSNEHEPIHVHARYGDSESKIEILIRNGAIQGLKIQKVAGKKPLPAAQAKHFKKLATVLADEIVQNWVNYFVYHKKIVAKKIAGKL
jgi:hypothetical protein